MDDVELVAAPLAAIGTTALGRLEMRVPDEDGFEEVAVERRWPDMGSARAWCERQVARAAPGAVVLEITVFRERWSHAKSWETTGNHPIAEELQLGVVVDGRVRWSSERPMVPRAGSRHLL